MSQHPDGFCPKCGDWNERHMCVVSSLKRSHHTDGVTHACGECLKSGAAGERERILGLLRGEFCIWQAKRNSETDIEHWWARNLPNGREFANWIESKLKEMDEDK